ncbi:hypothetical protein DN752_17390 [Echinicola strongylocentroti]|uniref:GtrA/DPMS transmembrane domain-containing protein n=1 Tax=Echinicola strongylocentroti TaxID=1795355 RepID=A0A2Z4IM15_9BACT|nr:hypothetical protein DN752_17390 [Echinicola strongylocentroti]
MNRKRLSFLAKLKKMAKFSLVGLLGLLIDYGITFGLVFLMGYNVYIANSIGFALACFNNFFLEQILDFQKSKRISNQRTVYLFLYLSYRRSIKLGIDLFITKPTKLITTYG